MTKNLKNALALIAISLFVVLAGLSFSVKSEAACSHSSTKTTTTAATCTSAGKVVVSCRSCGKTIRTQTISSLGHSYTVTTKNPTCTSTGTKKCSRCSSTTSISSLGHSKSTRTTQPTCGANGKTETYCTRCSAVISTATIPATGKHNYSVTTKNATCTATGTKKCANCASTTTTSALGHSKSTRTTQPTCGANGKTETYCTRCSTVISTATIPATGKHTYTVTKAATCTTAGSKKCNNCAATATIPATGHVNTSTRTTQPTCGANGKTEKYCTKCNYVISTTTIPATGNHTYTVTTAATCTTAGSKKCNNCAATATIPATGHVNTSTRTTQPTCGANGKTEKYCTKCNYVISTTTIPATGNHNYEITTAATCTEKGSKKCKNCVATATIPATGHTEAERTTAPACTASGKFEKYCTKCNKTLSSMSIQSLGHSFDITKHPTCTTAGSRTCSKCGEVEVIPALGHKTETRVRKEATCGEAGIKETYCTVCNEVLSASPIAATNMHSEFTMVTKEASCFEDGVKVTFCRNCDKNSTEPIPAIGKHSYKTKTLATCDTEGVDVCEVCGLIKKSPATNNHFPGTRKTEATCGAAGKEEIYCKTCGHIFSTTVIPATGNHIQGETVEKNKATCLEPGIREVHCAICNAVMSAYVTPATGHEEVTEQIEARTSEKDGISVTKCKYCNTIFSTQIVHNIRKMEVEKATATKPGVTVEYCTVCEKVISTYQTTSTPPEFKEPNKCSDGHHVVAGASRTDGSGTKHFKKCEKCKYWIECGKCYPKDHYYELFSDNNKIVIHSRECNLCGYVEISMGNTAIGDSASAAQLELFSTVMQDIMDELTGVPVSLAIQILVCGKSALDAYEWYKTEDSILDQYHDKFFDNLGQYGFKDLEYGDYAADLSLAQGADIMVSFKINNDFLEKDDMIKKDGNNFEVVILDKDNYGIKTCTDHHIVTEVIIEPTCTTEGKRKVYCDICNREFTTESIAPVAQHDFEVKKYATCGEDGYKKCKYCDTTMPLYATGNHMPGILEGCNSENGENIIYCKSCKAILSGTVKKIDVAAGEECHDHIWDPKYKSDKGGSHCKVCLRCSKKSDSETCIKDKHYYDVFIDSKKYTVCIERCLLCHYEAISMAEHSIYDPYSDLAENVQDTCEATIDHLSDVVDNQTPELEYTDFDEPAVDIEYVDLIIETEDKTEEFRGVLGQFIDGYQSGADITEIFEGYEVWDLNEERYAEERQFVDGQQFSYPVNVTDESNVVPEEDISHLASAPCVYNNP